MMVESRSSAFRLPGFCIWPSPQGGIRGGVLSAVSRDATCREPRTGFYVVLPLSEILDRFIFELTFYR